MASICSVFTTRVAVITVSCGAWCALKGEGSHVCQARRIQHGIDMFCLCCVSSLSWLLVVGPSAAMSIGKEGGAQLHGCKRESWKNKINEKMRKNTRKPALPMLGVGVLTGW